MDDRFDLKIDDITVRLKPLDHLQKTEIEGCYEQKGGKILPLADKQLYLLIKYMIDDISGFYNYDDTPYVVEKVNGFLSEKCINEILNINIQNKLLSALYSCKTSLPPQKIFDFFTYEELEGAEIIYSGKAMETVEEKKQ